MTSDERDIAEADRGRRRQAGREETAASEAMGRFVANVSHEIRTSMNGVLGMSGLLLQTQLTARQREYAQVIQSSCLSLLKLINSILDFSSIEAGKLVLESVDFSVREKVADIALLFAAAASEKNLDVRCELSDDVPAIVRGDPLRLGQILANLLSNAIKFSRDGRIDVRCERLSDSRLERGEVRLRFAVVDCGPGIRTENRSGLFERYGQGQGDAGSATPGTGLGLAISRELATLMGGTIGFDSEPGIGSTFWFTIVAEDADLQLVEALAEQRSEPGPSQHSGHLAGMPDAGAKVLIVDDNEGSLLVARRMCEELGFQVDAVTSGEAALEAHHRQEYAAIFIDSQMPGMSGNETTRIIRSRERDGRYTPVIALTANARFRDKREAFAAGVDRYLTKPVLADDIARCLSQMFESLPGPDGPDENGVRSSSVAAPAEVLDWLMVDELRRIPGGQGLDLFSELADQFLNQMPVSMRELRRAVESQDMRDVRRQAHRLLGVCRQIGAQRLAEACVTLERLPNDTSESVLRRHLDALQSEFQAAYRELDNRHMNA